MQKLFNTPPLKQEVKNEGNILLLTLQAGLEAQKDMYDKHKIWIITGRY